MPAQHTAVVAQEQARAIADIFVAAMMSPVNLAPSERLRFAKLAVADFRAMLKEGG